jgi:hypothetical protein
MTPRITKTLSALLLTLATLPALAGQADSVMFGQPSIKLAQLSPDEWRALRERWELASPEERIRLRQFFQDRMRQLPAPAQDALRIPFPAPQREDTRRTNPPSDSSFGFGFERRRSNDDERR